MTILGSRVLNVPVEQTLPSPIIRTFTSDVSNNSSETITKTYFTIPWRHLVASYGTSGLTFDGSSKSNTNLDKKGFRNMSGRPMLVSVGCNFNAMPSESMVVNLTLSKGNTNGDDMYIVDRQEFKNYKSVSGTIDMSIYVHGSIYLEPNEYVGIDASINTTGLVYNPAYCYLNIREEWY